MNRTQNLKLRDEESGPSAFIHVLGSETWGQDVGEFLTLGRDSSCSLQMEDAAVSAKHMRIEKKDHGYLLRDLRSSNGTYLNGAKVLEAYLHEGDRIQVGRSSLIFSYKRNLTEHNHTLSSKNRAWNETLKHLPDLSQSDLPVLILGPSGSGKELLAQSLHENSMRRSAPLISVNCSALSESLIESELFGHLKGSFTGATENRKGAFEAARGGTLFLDEVGDLPLSLQPKLLRALENREIRPVGSDVSVKTDVRVVAATHHDLRQKVFQGHFRLDLYYRLNVLQIKVPSLNQRMEDFDSLLAQFSKEYQVSFSSDVSRALKEYGWPGNIRELKNFVAKSKAYCGSKVTSVSEIAELFDGFEMLQYAAQSTESQKEPEARVSSSLIKELEYELIVKRLAANKGNQRKTALELGIPKSTLHDRIKAYNIKV